MKKRNIVLKENAFTIIEVLAVIIILSALATLVVPGVSNYLKDGKDTYNKEVKELMILSAKTYYSENENLLPHGDDGLNKSYVTVGELASKKYETGEFVDSEKRKCVNESYVVAVRVLGLKEIKYYACMKCEGVSYITEEEKDYCDITNFNTSTEGVNPTCNMTGRVVDEGYEVTITAKANGDEADYIEAINVVQNHETVVNKLTDEEVNLKNKEIIKKFIVGYGDYTISVTNSKDRSVKCGAGISRRVPSIIKDIKYETYFVTPEQYESHKEFGFTSAELEKLPTYSNENWQKGYVYVELNYRSEEYKEILVDSENIKGKKFLWLEKEGDVSTTIKTENINGKVGNIVILTKLDRTAPPKPIITNTSNEKWTNKDVTVTAESIDTYSGTKKIEYSTDNKTWSNTWNSNNISKVSKNYNTTTNITLYVRAIDNVGIEGASQSTIVRVDKTPPDAPKVTGITFKNTTEKKHNCNNVGGGQKSVSCTVCMYVGAAIWDFNAARTYSDTGSGIDSSKTQNIWTHNATGTKYSSWTVIPSSFGWGISDTPTYTTLTYGERNVDKTGNVGYSTTIYYKVYRGSAQKSNYNTCVNGL